MSLLVERLEEEAMQHSASSFRNGCPDCGIASNLASEAASRIEALERALRNMIGIIESACVPLSRYEMAELREARSTLHNGKGD